MSVLFMFTSILIDISLTADGTEKRVKAHKVILAAASSFFYTMLTSQEFAEGKEERILILKELDNEVLEWVLRFIYTGTLCLKGAKQLLKLYQAADRLDISSLCHSCFMHAQYWLSFATCVDMLLGSWRFGLLELHAACESYLLQNFEAVRLSFQCMFASALDQHFPSFRCHPSGEP
jgi:hypothetical protein